MLRHHTSRTFPRAKARGPMETLLEFMLLPRAKARGPIETVHLFITPIPCIGMDVETIRKLDDVVFARAGVLGKLPATWSEGEDRQIDAELEMMPGEYRAVKDWRGATRDNANQKLAESYGLDTWTMTRITTTGGEKIMKYLGHPASPLRDPNPGLEGYTYGVDVLDAVITPS